MSFSGNIKEEISRQLSPARHCQIAELAAIISMCGAVMIDSRGHAALKIHTENLAVARKSFTLLRRTFNIVVDIAIRVNREKGSSYYYIVVKTRRCYQGASGGKTAQSLWRRGRRAFCSKECRDSGDLL